ncbi:PREDICTED: uncharacterized protein LOC109132853 [Camelina sativa]|uniref:Uncharacterized protein LOC109132853 n=1 Tax=Camelina sativa TaxID=90675 RepID=A0ABM1RP97_CAMSA|nr:PREDICTED: uncharacterized protein LOC109132853 [Camelina sativa]
MDIIGNYGKASGQEVNMDKSSIMFGKKVPSEVKEKVKSVIGISKEGGLGSYLGIPESLGGSKAQVFGYVRDRLNDRVNGWNAKFLSKGGKEVLLKSVALALPTHGKIGGSTGWLGIKCVRINQREDWDFGIWKFLMMRYWLNSIGV